LYAATACATPACGKFGYPVCKHIQEAVCCKIERRPRGGPDGTAGIGFTIYWGWVHYPKKEEIVESGGPESRGLRGGACSRDGHIPKLAADITTFCIADTFDP